jgi:hypothetical protein
VVISVLFEARVSSPGWTLRKQENEDDAKMKLHQQDQDHYNYSATI